MEHSPQQNSQEGLSEKSTPRDLGWNPVSDWSDLDHLHAEFDAASGGPGSPAYESYWGEGGIFELATGYRLVEEDHENKTRWFERVDTPPTDQQSPLPEPVEIDGQQDEPEDPWFDYYNVLDQSREFADRDRPYYTDDRPPSAQDVPPPDQQ